jgi:hypothetical protein
MYLIPNYLKYGPYTVILPAYQFGDKKVRGVISSKVLFNSGSMA